MWGSVGEEWKSVWGECGSRLRKSEGSVLAGGEVWRSLWEDVGKCEGKWRTMTF